MATAWSAATAGSDTSSAWSATACSQGERHRASGRPRGRRAIRRDLARARPCRARNGRSRSVVSRSSRTTGFDERGLGPCDRHEQHLHAEGPACRVGAGERATRRRRSVPRRGAPRAPRAPCRGPRASRSSRARRTAASTGVIEPAAASAWAASAASSARSRSRTGASMLHSMAGERGQGCDGDARGSGGRRAA